MDQQIQRQLRVSVDIPVTITTVLDIAEASIVDLNEDGALISGCSLPAGTRFQLDYMDQTLYAQCRWCEVDRMGIRFTFALAEGPLYERLTITRASRMPGVVGEEMYASAAARGFGRAHMATGFGRRAG